MSDTSRTDEHVDFDDTHLFNLKQYVVIIAHKDENQVESIGSGVLVNIGGRHVVATARHCIENDPRVIPKNGWFVDGRMEADRPLTIVERRWHDTLDIGFLELDTACNRELQQSQLSWEHIAGGSVYVIGHPVCQIQRFPDEKTMDIQCGCIGIKPLQETADVLKFSYARQGIRQGDDNKWRSEVLPKAPGLSGGGIFGVASPSTGPILSIQYKLFGIQYAWHARERWIKAVPIRRWLDFVRGAKR